MAIPNLIARVDQFLVHPPEDELDVQQLQGIREQLGNVEPDPRVQQALANIANLFQGIGVGHEPLPAGFHAEQLVPDGVDFQAEQIAILHQIQQANGAALEEPPQVENPAEPPRAIDPPHEEPLYLRMFNAFKNAMQDLWQFLKDFYTSICAPNETIVQVDQAPPAEPQVEIVGELAEGENPPLHINRRICNHFLTILWDHLLAGGVDQDINPLIMHLREADLNDFPRIQEAVIGGWEDQGQNYRNHIHQLRRETARNPQQRLIGALLTKGEEYYTILIDGRDQADIHYYCFDPNPQALLFASSNFDEFIRHLEANIPIEEATPYAIEPLRVI